MRQYKPYFNEITINPSTDTSKGQKYLRSIFSHDCTKEEIQENVELLDQFVHEDCNFLIIYGPGNNGKSVLTKILSEMFDKPQFAQGVELLEDSDLLIYEEPDDEKPLGPFPKDKKCIVVTCRSYNQFKEKSFIDEYKPSYLSLTNRFDKENRKSFTSEEIEEISSQLASFLVVSCM